MPFEPNEEILAALNRGASVEELRQLLANQPADQEVEVPDQPDEHCERLAGPRRYFEAAKMRAILQVGDRFSPCPRDYQTAVELAYIQEVGATFCNVVDPYGSQLGKSIDAIAQRCVNAESLNKKQSWKIDEAWDEINELREKLWQATGSKK